MSDVYNRSMLLPKLQVPIPRPTFYSYAHDMNALQTSMWIWTMGFNKGWQEAENYSKSFLENDISGFSLPTVTLYMLENELGVQNFHHRVFIKLRIDSLFPGNVTNHVQLLYLPTASCLTESQNVCVSCMVKHSPDVSMRSVDGNSEYMQNSAFNSSDAQMVSITTEVVPLNSRKLILSVRPEEQVQDGVMENIVNRFKELNYIVDVSPSSTKPWKYVVVFKNTLMAQEAYDTAETIGYKLSKYRAPRPCPNNPAKYKALVDQTIKKGKSMNQDDVGKIFMDEVIVLNQAKGRRVRIVSVETGKSIGWVSLYAQYTGKPLLERVDQVNQ